MLGYWSFGYAIMRGSDLWWHLAAGRWIVSHPSWPLTDPFSYTRYGEPWLHHEWLSDVLYHGWTELFGVPGLAYWKWGVLLAAFVLLFRLLHRLTDDAVASYASVLLAIAAASPFLDVRPHLYSLLGTVVVVWLTLVLPRPSWLLPWVFLIWVNLHGGFFFGLLALGGMLAVVAALGGAAEWRRAVSIWLACAAASLINPNGLEVFAYPLKYAFDKSSPFLTLGEWFPPFASASFGATFWVFLLAVLSLGAALRYVGWPSASFAVLVAGITIVFELSLNRELLRGGIRSPLYPTVIGAFAGAAVYAISSRELRGRALPLAGVLLGALTLAMSLRSRRFIPLFAICTCLVLAPVLAEIVRALRRRAAVLRRVPALLPPSLALVLGLWWMAPYPVRPYAFAYLTAEDLFPVETLNFIETNRLSGRVFAYYNWGGYVHLRTGGRLKVFIDGRADTVFDAETYDAYMDVLRAREGWLEIIEDSGADFVLWPSREGRHVRELIESGRWAEIYTDHVSVLLAHEHAVRPALFEATRDSAYRRLARGSAELRRGRLAEAEAELREALVMQPTLGQACYTLAQTRAAAGSLREAWETTKRCHRIYPDRAKLQRMREHLEPRLGPL